MKLASALACLAALHLVGLQALARPSAHRQDGAAAAQRAFDPDKPKDPKDPPVEPQPDPDPDPDPRPDPQPEPEPDAQICAADLNGNGDAADRGEVASCTATIGGGGLCPLGTQDCVLDASNVYRCPAGSQFACLRPLAGGPPACSPNPCARAQTMPIVEAPPIADPGRAADGPVDADGHCLGTVEIFSGRGMRCRAAGLNTTFANCCADRGKIVRDGMGSSANGLGTKIAVAKGVYTGMSAAFAAFRAGATAGEAASAGANALIVGLDPTSLAISLAISFMMEFLFSGCDQEDMEVGLLRGSGMCHQVGSYCTASFLGLCLQKAYGHCCFNTKLGRIIQEQGRPQLKAFNAIGWGTPQQPVCRGFTAEEFQALDFSKIDLSDYYADLEARAQSDITIDMTERVDAYRETFGN